MTKRVDILCGGMATQGLHAADATIYMDVQGPGRNVKLRIEDITRAMVSNIPDVLLDLLEIAAYVYCADQRLLRGSDRLADYGANWHRKLNFTIPLRRPELWESRMVKEPLAATLGFLSDDAYSFSFVKAARPLAEKALYFPQLIEGAFQPDEVALFSGGIDSFAGAVDDLVRNRKNLALAGHHSANKVVNVQKELIQDLKQAGLNRQIFYIPVNVTNTNVNAREYTQRTRSFLFACLGLVVARIFGKDSFTFYENGVLSINLPIAHDVQGARATRTTHPKVLRGFEALFSAVLDREITIRTPFQWLTKKEVVNKIAESGFSYLLSKTVSCTRPRQWTTSMRHCGACSQCIDRRFAILAAGLEEHDPGEHYMTDLLTGARDAGDGLRMAIAYIKFFRTLAATPKNRFVADYTQLASALPHFPALSAAAAKDRIYDLYQRHAADVLAVIAEGTKRHMDALVHGELPETALLSLCFTRSQVEIAPAKDYDRQVKEFMDRLSPLPFEFAVDEGAQRILFRGGFFLEGKSYDLVEALLENFRAGKKTATDIAYIPASDLALKLSFADASLRQQVTRLRKLVTDRLAVDLGIPLGANGFIENKERAGYRLSPFLREVSLGDLETIAADPVTGRSG
jgi:hypothetical protein